MQTGERREEHARAAMMNWLMNANEDECMWQTQITRRMTSAAAGLPFCRGRKYEELMCIWPINTAAATVNSPLNQIWHPYHKSYTGTEATADLPIIPRRTSAPGWSEQIYFMPVHPNLYCHMDWVLELTVDQCTSRIMSSPLCLSPWFKHFIAEHPEGLLPGGGEESVYVNNNE